MTAGLATNQEGAKKIVCEGYVYAEKVHSHRSTSQSSISSSVVDVRVVHSSQAG